MFRERGCWNMKLIPSLKRSTVSYCVLFSIWLMLLVGNVINPIQIDTYINPFPFGTQTCIVGVWFCDEQKLRSWIQLDTATLSCYWRYILAFCSDSFVLSASNFPTWPLFLPKFLWLIMKPYRPLFLVRFSGIYVGNITG